MILSNEYEYEKKIFFFFESFNGNIKKFKSKSNFKYCIHIGRIACPFYIYIYINTIYINTL